MTERWAKVRWLHLMRAVERGANVTITRRGKPVAQLVTVNARGFVRRIGRCALKPGAAVTRSAGFSAQATS